MLSDNTVVDVSTGYRVDITKEQFLRSDKTPKEELSNNIKVYINDYLLEFPDSSKGGEGRVVRWQHERKWSTPEPTTIRSAIGDDPIVWWRYQDREREAPVETIVTQATGTFSSIYLYKGSKGDPLLFLVSDKDGLISILFVEENKISQHTFEVDVYPTIRFSNGYLVIGGYDRSEPEWFKKSYKNYVYRIHY